MSQPTNDHTQPPTTDSASADEQLLLAALARFVLGRTAALHVTTSDTGAMLTATARDPFTSPRLFLDRATAAVYVVPNHVANLQLMAQLVADLRRRADLEVVWREPTRPVASPERPACGDTVTVVMTETIVFRHSFTRTELAELLRCAPDDVEQEIADHGDDDVWLRETLAEHYSHTSDRALTVEVTR